VDLPLRQTLILHVGQIPQVAWKLRELVEESECDFAILAYQIRTQLHQPTPINRSRFRGDTPDPQALQQYLKIRLEANCQTLMQSLLREQGISNEGRENRVILELPIVTCNQKPSLVEIHSMREEAIH
jgi:hypothetical protein